MNIKDFIAEGEHQRQDFKFGINDSKKIARSLAAFANTAGGRLLVGVKDNGAIAGVRSDEEFYMVEAASQLYTKPNVEFIVKQHVVDGKRVLEIYIPKSKLKPHSAPTPNGDYKVYIRVADQNLLANKILLDVWKRRQENKPVLIRFSDKEKILFEYLEENETISLSKFCKIATITRKKAERILTDLIVLDLIYMEITEKAVYFSAVAEY